MVDGYAFANGFVNVLATLPTGTRVATAGRCGGMAYSVLDHALAGRDVPAWGPHLFAPDRVPPDGHVVADHLARRQLDSFRTPSALRFLTWSVLPDADLGPLAGVRTRTRRELRGVLRSLAQGRPVVLGMVVARSLLRAGDNHQVVATGFARDGDAVTLTLHDPNSPGRAVTLVETPDGWRASNGRLWRGFFRHAYAPRTPPPLPSASRRPRAAVRAGAPVGLVHVATGLLLVVDGDRPALAMAASTGSSWVPTLAVGAARALTDGDAVHLRVAPPVDGAAGHLLTAPPVSAASRAGAATAEDGQHLTVVDAEPALTGQDDDADARRGDDADARRRDDDPDAQRRDDADARRDDGTDALDGRAGHAPMPGDEVADRVEGAIARWTVVVDGGGAWREGSRVRLVHAATGALLAGSRAGPTTTFTPDASTWWTVAAPPA
ncbi:hypothetical protein [Cellulomonas iranensis]|uniref:Peptidase C39-like domain-containing protein n=1 Tax=Cellulomonas iranensis TaxID=76862 RepID=A0ABU0GKD4_9CELL|nr:hypothetical protein [Cellulomonas iranensis]MDQ0425823.1 hypothetical protein [Cellulomonas iranensis]